MEVESKLPVNNSNEESDVENSIYGVKKKGNELKVYVSDSDVDDEEKIQRTRLFPSRSFAFIREPLKKEIPTVEVHPKKRKHIEEEDRLAAMRRRLDVNKLPIDVGELNPHIEIEDVIVAMLKIAFPAFF